MWQKHFLSSRAPNLYRVCVVAFHFRNTLFCYFDFYQINENQTNAVINAMKQSHKHKRWTALTPSESHWMLMWMLCCVFFRCAQISHEIIIETFIPMCALWTIFRIRNWMRTIKQSQKMRESGYLIYYVSSVCRTLVIAPKLSFGWRIARKLKYLQNVQPFWLYSSLHSLACFCPLCRHLNSFIEWFFFISFFLNFYFLSH